MTIDDVAVATMTKVGGRAEAKCVLGALSTLAALAFPSPSPTVAQFASSDII
jgi:hypothetical protein